MSVPVADPLTAHLKLVSPALVGVPVVVPFRTQHPLGAVVNRPSVWSDR
jgi:hypothetical protein